MKQRKSLTPKADKVFESYFNRYTAACFAVNDVIKIDESKLKKLDSFKSLPQALKDATLDLCEREQNGDIVLQVAHVQLHYGVHEDASPSTITIGAAIGGGRFIDEVTLPGSCGEAIEIVTDPVNQISTIPPNARRDYRIQRDGADKFGRYELDLDKLEKNRMNGYAATVDGKTPYEPLDNPPHYGNYFHKGL